jgi:hypothetical protein
MSEKEKCSYKLSFSETNKILDEQTEILIGKVLTLLEAVIENDRQSEATKKTVKQYCWAFNKDIKSILELKKEG